MEKDNLEGKIKSSNVKVKRRKLKKISKEVMNDFWISVNREADNKISGEMYQDIVSRIDTSITNRKGNLFFTIGQWMEKDSDQFIGGFFDIYYFNNPKKALEQIRKQGVKNFRTIPGETVDAVKYYFERLFVCHRRIILVRVLGKKLVRLISSQISSVKISKVRVERDYCLFLEW